MIPAQKTTPIYQSNKKDNMIQIKEKDNMQHIK